MLANALIFCAATVALLLVLDVFVSEIQKKAISDWLLAEWNRLDDLGRRIEAKLFSSRGILIALILLSFALNTVWQFYLRQPSLDEAVALIIITIASAVVGIWLGPLFVPIVRSVDERKLLAFVLVLAVILVVNHTLILPAYRQIIAPYPAVDQWLNIFFLYLMTLSLAVTGPMILVQLAKDGVGMAEFVLRRIAEYPKGPIIALSIVLGAIAAFLKTIGS